MVYSKIFQGTCTFVSRRSPKTSSHRMLFRSLILCLYSMKWVLLTATYNKQGHQYKTSRFRGKSLQKLDWVTMIDANLQRVGFTFDDDVKVHTGGKGEVRGIPFLTFPLSAECVAHNSTLIETDIKMECNVCIWTVTDFQVDGESEKWSERDLTIYWACLYKDISRSNEMKKNGSVYQSSTICGY